MQGGLTKAAFRRYYALRASSTVSRGAHDEWNIFRMINETRRADSKIGTPGQIPVLFDGRGVAPHGRRGGGVRRLRRQVRAMNAEEP